MDGRLVYMELKNIRCYVDDMIDLYKAYKILKFVHEQNNANVTEIGKYLNSYTTAVKYVEILLHLGLLEEIKIPLRRGKVVRVSKKGLDYLFIFSRLLSIVGIHE